MADNTALPQLPDPAGFNPYAELPYGCTPEHIRLAMNEFIDFLSFVNQQLATKDIPRLETMLMPANFSSMVGEFVIASIPKYCPTLAKNRYHNGHPDLIPVGRFPKNRVQYTTEGIEVKASRYVRSWQGHNPEAVWLMVIVFESNRASDSDEADEGTAAVVIPFRFLMVAGAQLEKEDWKFAGRSATSRRTITASVADSGYQKMMLNWIYKAPRLRK
ncbi:MAG TPA: hypothetical protein PLD47_14180 [Aggregatilineales bacterium]|nr:hypothetical protein [Anaerolineales bacterium]HRE48871.1 hypothetical protein [Aggregatilineales bacterium]